MDLKVAWLAACACSMPSPAPKPIDVVALSEPAAWLASAVGGPRIRVSLLPPPGVEGWRPDAAAVARMQRADLLVTAGAGFESWLGTTPVPTSKLVDTTWSLDLLHVDGDAHRHGEGPPHRHQGVAALTWHDPTLWAAQARRVRDAFVIADPMGAQAYGEGLARLERDLAQVATEAADLGEALRGVTFVANHPTFVYLARAMGHPLHYVHQPAEGPVDAEQIRRLAELMDGRVAILWWDGPPADAVQGALPMAVRSVVLDTMVDPGDGDRDLLLRFRSNLLRIEEATR